MSASSQKVYTREQLEAAIETAQERAGEFTHDAHALEIFAGAVLALIDNPLSEYPAIDEDSAEFQG
ncbi:hypothetical protein ACFYY1_37265 [Streptomyces sp. NPDC001890]|uniref:hypothetical protein n=1 Tax=Streptomyces sp. NPDC001890 TaxID=3364620 RepID=UPI00368311FE